MTQLESSPAHSASIAGFTLCRLWSLVCNVYGADYLPCPASLIEDHGLTPTLPTVYTKRRCWTSRQLCTRNHPAHDPQFRLTRQHLWRHESALGFVQAWSNTSDVDQNSTRCEEPFAGSKPDRHRIMFAVVRRRIPPSSKVISNLGVPRESGSIHARERAEPCPEQAGGSTRVPCRQSLSCHHC